MKSSRLTRVTPGSLTCGPLLSSFYDYVYLRQFFVVVHRRRQRIGQAAFAWLLENAWHDAGRIRLDVLVGNEAGIRFWKSLGFDDYCITLERDING